MFKVDQKGQSLPIVLGVTALILANTYYFLAVDKTSTARNKMTQTTIETQTEQNRISSYLADINACAKQKFVGGVPVGGPGGSPPPAGGSGNFYWLTLASLTNPAAPPTADLISSASTGSQVFLKVGSLYAKKSLQVTKYYLQADDSISTSATNEVRYYLVVEYAVKNVNSRKSTMVKIPLVIQTDASDRILNCYARPSTIADTSGASSTLATAVSDACKNPAAPAPTDTRTANLDTTSSTALASCNHNITPTLCPAGTVLKSAASNQTAGSTTLNRQDFTCEALVIPVTACPAAPNPQVFTGVVSSAATCGSANSCGVGQMLIKNGATATACTTNCNVGSAVNYELFHSYAPNGTPTCYPLARANTCPSGMYAKSVDANGVPSCEYIHYRNVTCPASYFATDMDPVNGLNCQYFNMAKNCAGQHNYSAHFVWTTPACRNFTF